MTTIRRKELIAALTDDATARQVETELADLGISLTPEIAENIAPTIESALDNAENLFDAGALLQTNFRFLFDTRGLAKHVCEGMSADSALRSTFVVRVAQSQRPNAVHTLHRAIVDIAVSCAVDTVGIRMEEEFQEHFCTFEAYHIDITD